MISEQVFLDSTFLTNNVNWIYNGSEKEKKYQTPVTTDDTRRLLSILIFLAISKKQCRTK